MRAVGQVTFPGATVLDTTGDSTPPGNSGPGAYRINLNSYTEDYRVDLPGTGFPAGASVLLPPGGSHLVSIVTGDPATNHRDDVDFLLVGLHGHVELVVIQLLVHELLVELELELLDVFVGLLHLLDLDHVDDVDQREHDQRHLVDHVDEHDVDDGGHDAAPVLRGDTRPLQVLLGERRSATSSPPKSS